MTIEHEEGAIAAAAPDTEPQPTTEFDTAPDDSPPEKKLRAANLFCGTGSLSLMAQEAGIEVVYAHDTKKRNRDAYTKNVGLVPDDRGKSIYFADVPRFDVLLATLPRSKNPETAMAFIVRYLVARRPDTFAIAGAPGVNEESLVAMIREQTRTLFYGVASGAEVLRGIYTPTNMDVPLIAGTLHLDPVNIPLMSSEEPAEGDNLSTVRVMLQRIAQTV